jgi:tetratricopeptide (TPR) repeat protein
MTSAQQLHDEAFVNYQAGRLAEAEVLCRAALAADPSRVASLALLGLLAQQTARLDLAVVSLAKAAELAPGVAAIQCSLGDVLVEWGCPDAAAACYRRALQLDPELLEALNSLGRLLRAQGRLADAAECYRRGLALRPDVAELHFNLAGVLFKLGQPDAAITGFRTALQCRPDFPEAHNSLGTVYSDLGQPEAAAACYRQALAARPDYADALANLGNSLRNQGRLDAAEACHRRAIASIPQDLDTVKAAVVHTNLAIVLLSQGRLPEGLKEFEWRWLTPQLADGVRNFPQPQWFGEAAAGRTLLLHAEQGYGDTLQFCRYAALAAARGLRVVLEVQPSLVRLLRCLDGASEVVALGENLPPFDLQCPMMSMPLALGTTVNTIPARPAYLRADAAAVARWRLRLDTSGRRRLRVGLVWAGNPRSYATEPAAIDRRRSLAAERLRPLFEVRDVQFFSLQKTGPDAPEDLPLIRLMHEMEDFADTAALVANLDLVISVDTAVAHLAAGLGVPVWLLDRFDPCWRWLTDRRDSPWYPSLRIYRQPRAGDWDTVIAEAVRDLQCLAADPRPLMAGVPALELS